MRELEGSISLLVPLVEEAGRDCDLDLVVLRPF